MTVAQLQQVITDLARLLESAGLTRTAFTEVTTFTEKLDKFRDLKLSTFADLLDRLSLDGAVTAKTGGSTGRKSGSGPAVDVDAVVAEAGRLYDHASDPGIPGEQFHALVDQLDRMGKADLQRVAERIGMKVPKSITVPKLKDAVYGRIEGRRGASIRRQLLDRPADGGLSPAAPVIGSVS